MNQNAFRSIRPYSLAASALMVCAPVVVAQGIPASAWVPAAPSLMANNDTPQLDLTAKLTPGAGTTYSSSAVDASVAEYNVPGLSGDAAQPPPRRRYGRPRYNDNSHNPDGSSKYAFEVGVGLTAPTGNTYHYLNTDYAYQLGAGRNFDKNFSLMLQFDWDAFGFNGRTLANQRYLYDYGIPTTSQYYINYLDGKSHVWSLSLNPVYNIYSGQGLGAYVVGGVGFYHKTANFTVPVTGYTQDPYSGLIYQYQANQTIDKYTSNAPGFNGGFGITFKPSRFSSQKLFVEARYVFVDNSQRYGFTVANVSTTKYNGFNVYPANSNRTTYIPIKAGIRF